MHCCWHGFFRTNFINTIVPKNCAPKTCQSFQTLGHGTCVASLAGSETKRAELLAQIFQDKFHQRDCPKNWCQRLLTWSLNAGQRDMHGKKFFAGSVFILHGVLSVDAWFSLGEQRSKIKQEPKHRICIRANGQVGK